MDGRVAHDHETKPRRRIMQHVTITLQPEPTEQWIWLSEKNILMIAMSHGPVNQEKYALIAEWVKACEDIQVLIVNEATGGRISGYWCKSTDNGIATRHEFWSPELGGVSIELYEWMPMLDLVRMSQ